VLQSIAVGYGRRHDDPDPLLSAEDRNKQKRTLATYTENRYTNPIQQDDAYRTPVLCETHTYELLKVAPAANEPGVTNLSRFEEMQELVQAAGDGSHDVPYEDINVMGDPQALEHLIKLTGRTSIPVIMVDDQVVQGFDKPKLKSLLGL